MKKTKYLVLSAAAILAVGCKGNGGKMPSISDADAVTVATKLVETQKEAWQGLPEANEEVPEYDIEKVPFKKLTITKNYSESYEENLYTGADQWEDKETHKLAIDLENLRASVEISDSDTATDAFSTGKKLYAKVDIVYQQPKMYICLNINNLSYTKMEMRADKKEALSYLLEFYYDDRLDLPLKVLSQYDTGVWAYLTGSDDRNTNYIFDHIMYVDDKKADNNGSKIKSLFPGYLEMIVGKTIREETPEDLPESSAIIRGAKAIRDAIEKGDVYKKGSHADYSFGSNDVSKASSIYCEIDTKLIQSVELDPEDYDYVTDNADCDYQTGMTVSYVDNFLSKVTIDHNQSIVYTLLGANSGAFKKRSANQTVEIKRDAKIADVNLEDYTTVDL